MSNCKSLYGDEDVDGIQSGTVCASLYISAPLEKSHCNHILGIVPTFINNNSPSHH